jgi:phage pi2 protein 07
MNYKSYLVLRPEGNPVDMSCNGGAATIKMSIRRGMTNADIKEALNVEDEWTPRTGVERLYFFPGCSVPRFKVREKFNVTIKPEYATAAFISTKGLENTEGIFEKQRLVELTPNAVTEWFEDIYGQSSYQTVKLKSVLLNCEDRVFMEYDHYQALWNHGVTDAVISEMASALSIIEKNSAEHLFYNPRWMNRADLSTLYVPDPEGMAKLKCTIYSQDAILRILNEGKIIVDETKYQDLRLMGLSSDDENIVLMMEIMSNANFDKSFVYLLLLLKEFSSRISTQKALQHVNFKGLLSYFGLGHKEVPNLTIEKLTAVMKKHKQFTRSNVQRISQHFGADESKSFVSENYITGPVLRPEAERELDEDFVSDADEIEIPEDEC